MRSLTRYPHIILYTKKGNTNCISSHSFPYGCSIIEGFVFSQSHWVAALVPVICIKRTKINGSDVSLQFDNKLEGIK
jgi:hypothetical protein